MNQQILAQNLEIPENTKRAYLILTGTFATTIIMAATYMTIALYRAWQMGLWEAI